MIRTPSLASINELENEITVLEQRLRDGEHRIVEAQALGTETGAWEEFWIELLRTYEAVCDRYHEMNGAVGRVAA